MGMRLAADIQGWVFFPGKEGQHTYLVGSKELDKYLVVTSTQYPIIMQVIEKLPTLEPDQIGEQLREQGIDTDVGGFCQLLASKGLLDTGNGAADSAPPAPAPKSLWANLRDGVADLLNRFRSLTWEVFSIPLAPLRRWIDAIAGWYWNGLVAGAVLTTLAIVLRRDFDLTTARQMVREMVAHQNFIWMAAVNALIQPFFVFFHELGHASAAARGGVYPRRLMCKIFVLGVPYFSLQLPGLFTLPFGHRMRAILAGPLVDLTLGNAALLLAHAVGGAMEPWFLLAALTNYGRGFYNALPLWPKSDGYAFVSQAVFREVDVRARAGKALRRWCNREVPGLELRFALVSLVNVGLVLALVAYVLVKANESLYEWGVAHVPSGVLVPDWAWVVGVVVIDGLLLFLVRNRIRALLAW